MTTHDPNPKRKFAGVLIDWILDGDNRLRARCVASTHPDNLFGVGDMIVTSRVESIFLRNGARIARTKNSEYLLLG